MVEERFEPEVSVIVGGANEGESIGGHSGDQGVAEVDVDIQVIVLEVFICNAHNFVFVDLLAPHLLLVLLAAPVDLEHLVHHVLCQVSVAGGVDHSHVVQHLLGCLGVVVLESRVVSLSFLLVIVPIVLELLLFSFFVLGPQNGQIGFGVLLQLGVLLLHVQLVVTLLHCLASRPMVLGGYGDGHPSHLLA
jgi:hypothetical protein